MQNLQTVAVKFIRDEIQNTNFFNEQGNFEFSKFKDYFLKDQKRTGNTLN